MRKIYSFLVAVTALILMPQHMKAENTVQQFGSATATSWAASSSTTNILSGSTVTLDGVVMTFGGTDNYWTWNSSAKGVVCDQMVNDGTNGITSISVGDNLPAYGSIYTFVVSKDGTLNITTYEANAGNIYFGETDGTTATTVVSKTKSSGSTTRTYEVSKDKTYYFFQAAKAAGTFTTYRNSLISIAFAEPSPVEVSNIGEYKMWNFVEEPTVWKDRTAADNYNGLAITGTVTFDESYGRYKIAASADGAFSFNVTGDGYLLILGKGGNNATITLKVNGTQANILKGTSGMVYSRKITGGTTDNPTTIQISGNSSREANIFAIGWIPLDHALVTSTASVTLDDKGFATYCPAYHVTIPEGVKAYYLSEVNSAAGTLIPLAITSDYIPAFTAVILKGTSNETYTFTVESGVNSGAAHTTFSVNSAAGGAGVNKLSTAYKTDGMTVSDSYTYSAGTSLFAQATSAIALGTCYFTAAGAETETFSMIFANRKVHTFGDSTCSTYDPATTKKRGWGQVLQEIFNDEEVVCMNWAKSGATAYTFYQNQWPGASEKISEGDYVIIQFGHNDEKEAYGGNPSTGDGTPQENYKNNLKTLINAVKAKGATPILATSVCRNMWDGNSISLEGRHDVREKVDPVNMPDGYDYPELMKEVATEENLYVLDMTTATKNYYETGGQSKVTPFFASGDVSHTVESGAKANVQLFKQEVISTLPTDHPVRMALKDETIVLTSLSDGEAYVNEATTWTASASTVATAGNVAQTNGLYLRATDAITFSDEAMQLASASLAPNEDTTAGADLSTTTGNALAFNAAVAGTVTVTVATTDKTTMNIFFNGEEISATATDNGDGKSTLRYTSTAEGTFFIGNSNGCQIYEVSFTPTEFIDVTWAGGAKYATFYSSTKSYRLSDYALTLETAPGKVYAVSALSGTQLLLTELPDNIVPAGTPVLMLGAEGETYRLTKEEEATSYTGDNLLQGTDEAQNIAVSSGDNSNYLLSDDGKSFEVLTTATNVGANSAWLQLPTASPTTVYVEGNTTEVTLDNYGYATFASTYPLDLDNMSATTAPKAYMASVSGTKVNFTEVSEAIAANTGILLEGGANETVTIPVAASGTDISSSNAFKVNTTGGKMASADVTNNYFFAMMKNQATLTFATFDPTNLAIPANKAYLEVAKTNFSNEPGARELTFTFGETTGIANVDVNTNDNFNANAPMYNMAGQRVGKNYKGIVIVNGKKYINK